MREPSPAKSRNEHTGRPAGRNHRIPLRNRAARPQSPSNRAPARPQDAKAYLGFLCWVGEESARSGPHRLFYSPAHGRASRLFPFSCGLVHLLLRHGMIFIRAPDHVLKLSILWRQPSNDLVRSARRATRQLRMKEHCFTDLKFVRGHRSLHFPNHPFAIELD